MKTQIAGALVAAAAAAAVAQPRFLCAITPAATCDQQVPGPIISDSSTPTQNSFGPFTCSQFWGDGVMTGSAFASNGVVGVDMENAWFGCASFGCGPSLLQISVGATHEFDVVFSSPTNDPIQVRANLVFTGNIQEVPGLYRAVNVSLGGPAFYTGRFGQIDSPGNPDIREGLLANFDEIAGSAVTTPSFTVPANTPVRFVMSIGVENAATLVGGGAVNFSRGFQLGNAPFTVVGTAAGVDPDDIDINSVGANIAGGVYGGAPCNADFNGDGTANVLDVVDFIANWNAAGVGADFNDDGMINVLDVVEFITAWDSGCP